MNGLVNAPMKIHIGKMSIEPETGITAVSAAPSSADSLSRDTARPVGRCAESSGPERPSCEEKMNDPDSDWYSLEFAVARSLRYHARRRAFFERCNHLTRALSAIASAGTIATAIQGIPAATIAAGAVVGLASALDLVFDFSKRAMIYDDLYRRFADLGIEIAATGQSAESYRALRVKMLLIEKEEPTSLDVLNVICVNAELESRGFDYRHKIGTFQRLFANFGDFGQQVFDRVDKKHVGA